ncbi:MAG TPA: efflux RND transporter periplasmic adaptor subunit [Thermoanaerobaculia bacterium]|jgi:HlyD family secretion protein|nr:efflux RND transporter periplasmic adaptor subunit [Thermoanaerobaculia bacterium]
MKKTFIIVGALVLVAVIIFASVKGGGSKGEPVYVEPVTARNIQAIVTAPGEIDPKVKVNISAYIIGKIEKLYFKEGDDVRKGQKLVDLERTAYQAAFLRAQSAVYAARIEVVRAKTAMATTEAAYKRALNLGKQGIQAQELFDQARQANDNAVAGYDSARQGVSQAEAILQSAQTDLDHTTILSPMNGKAVQLNAHEGEVVIPGTMNNPGSVIAVIADLSEILVEATVGETEITGIRLNQPARIHIDAIADKEYNGHVAEIGSSAALKQGTVAGMRYFTVKVQIDNPDDRLRPGMTAQVSIITTTAGSALSVPIQSVVERVPPSLAKSKSGADDEDANAPKLKYIFVVKDGKVKMTEVKTGISDTTHVALVSGGNAKDQVVTGPFRTLKKLKDGDSVEVTKEESKTPQSGTASK